MRNIRSIDVTSNTRNATRTKANLVAIPIKPRSDFSAGGGSLKQAGEANSPDDMGDGDSEDAVVGLQIETRYLVRALKLPSSEDLTAERGERQAIASAAGIY